MEKFIEFSLRSRQPGRNEFNRLPEEDLSDLHSSFAAFGSAGRHGISFRVFLHEHSPELKAIIKKLWMRGWRPVIDFSILSKHGTIKSSVYGIHAQTFAEKEDLDGESYIQLLSGPGNDFGILDIDSRPDGSCFHYLTPRLLDPSKRFGHLFHDFTGISDSFAHEMELAGFIGLSLDSPPLHPDPAKHPTEKVHILGSSIILPHLLNPLVELPGQDLAPIPMKPYRESTGVSGCYFAPDYNPPMLRFRRSEFEAMEPFDIARTQERFGGVYFHQRPKFIVSQRFRRWLDDQGLECTYHPIRLENPGDPEPDPPLAAICRELGMPLSTVPG